MIAEVNIRGIPGDTGKTRAGTKIRVDKAPTLKRRDCESESYWFSIMYYMVWCPWFELFHWKASHLYDISDGRK